MDMDAFVLAGPLVGVLASGPAEAACRRAGLGAGELLRPWTRMRDVNAPVRTVGESAYRLTSFNIRVHELRSMFQPVPDVARQHLAGLVGAAQAAPRGKDEVKGVGSLFPHPWFRAYHDEYLRVLQYSDFETYDLPVACVLMIDSREGDPVAQFQRLKQPNAVPLAVRDVCVDSAILKHYVLLHEPGTPTDVGRAAFKAICDAFGNKHCSLLTLNSRGAAAGDPAGPADPAGAPRDVWTPVLRPKLPGGGAGEDDRVAGPSAGRGATLSQEDVKGLEGFVRHFTVKCLVPHLEYRIRDLNHHITAARKGVKNQLKNYFFRKEKEEPRGNGDQLYSKESIEYQIRLLGDLAFVLRDFELAYSSFKLLAGDMKADKAWKHYAAAKEFVGLCRIMTGRSERDVEDAFDSAYNSYCANPATVKYAGRAMMLLAAHQIDKHMYAEAANSLRAAALDKVGHLQAALMFERAAQCYMLNDPSMARKFGFNMVLAGRNYGQSGNLKLAIRAYQDAREVYQAHGWAYINEHVNLALGRHFAGVGDHANAVKYFAEMLEATHQSVERQTHYIGELKGMVAALDGGGGEPALGSARRPLPLALPAVNEEDVYVHYEDHRCYGAGARSQPTAIWDQLEKRIVPAHATSAGATWMDAGALRSEEQRNSCIAGEEVGVDVEFTNTFRVPIEVGQVSLACRFQGDGGVDEDSAQYAQELPAAAEPAGTDLLTGAGADSVLRLPWANVHRESVSLKPGEKTKLRLKLHPLTEGTLRIHGVNFCLAGSVYGYVAFNIRGAKVRKPKPNGPLREYPPEQRLLFKVLPPMPRMAAALVGLPSIMYANEVVKCAIKVRNVGQAPSDGLRIGSTNGVLHCGASGGPGGAPGGADLLGIPEAAPVARTAERDEGGVYVFAGDLKIPPGGEVVWPVWIHASQHDAASESMSFHCAVYYEPEVAGPKMKFRLNCLSHTIQILPSLRASLTLSVSENHLQQCVAQLQVANGNSIDSFSLHELSCLNPDWTVQRLGAAGGGPATVVDRGDDLSSFFRLQQAPETLRRKSSITLSPQASARGEALDVDSEVVRAFVREHAKAGAGPAAKLDCSQAALFWSTVGRYDGNFHQGFQYLRGAFTSSSDAIKFVIEGRKDVTHDFAAEPVCHVPVSIHIRSQTLTSVHGSLKCLNAAPPDSSWTRDGAPDPPGGGGGGGLPNSRPYLWAGKTTASRRDIRPGDTMKEDLTVAVFGPGTYEIDRYRFCWVQDASFSANVEVPGPKFWITVSSARRAEEGVPALI